MKNLVSTGLIGHSPDSPLPFVSCNSDCIFNNWYILTNAAIR